MHFFTDKFQIFRNKFHERGLDDPRMLGIIILAVIGLSVVWNGIHVVQQNYALLQKIAVLEDENKILELENSNRKIQNEYYASPEFAELKARRVNGKAAPGEQVYIVTEDVALRNLKTNEAVAIVEEEVQKPKYQQNFEAWIEFFFGEKQSS